MTASSPQPASSPEAFLRAFDELTEALRAAADFNELLLRELADQRQAMLEGFTPGELLALLRRTRSKSLDCLVSGVYLELTAGRSWASIADGLGVPEPLARDMHQPSYLAWRARTGLDARPHPLVLIERPRGLWALLMRWRHRGNPGVSSAGPSRR